MRKLDVIEQGKRKFVLVGTYRLGQLDEWSDYYNYPVIQEEENALDWGLVKELWLFNKLNKQVSLSAKFIGIKERDELVKEYGYTAKGVPHSKRYVLFKVKRINKPTKEVGCGIILRTIDFSNSSPEIASKLTEYLKSANRKDLKLASRLPEILSLQPPENLIVCKDKIQMDFLPLLMMPKDADKKYDRPKFSFIDLFAGCGGLSLGMEEAGLTPLLVNELNSDAMGTYLQNRKDEFPWLCKNNVSNIKDLVLNEDLLNGFQQSILKDFGINIFNGELDLICGGPPCQGFSGLGIRRSYSVEKKQLPSNYLYQDMAFLVNKIRPKIFLFENVRGLLSAKWTSNGKKGEIFEDVLKTFKDIGAYHIRYKLVHAKDYGVPQNRPRILIVGLRKDIFAEPTSNSDAVSDGFLPKPVGGYPSIEDLVSDLINPKYQRGSTDNVYLKSPKSEIQKHLRTRRDGTIIEKGDKLTDQEYSNHSDMIVEKFSEMLKNGGEIPDRFKTKKFSQKVMPRVWGSNGPSITACSAPDDYVHFAQPRSFTVREWARLQTFPDWYEFLGKRTTGGLRRAGNPREGIFDRELPKYTQIGNAVPVQLAYNIGLHFRHLLEGLNNA